MSEQSTIGTQLRQTRQERGESLEQAHQRTGIGVRVLGGLEEDSDSVVEIVYMRLALQTYAGHLGLDVDALTRRFDEEHGSPDPGPPVQPVSLPASGISDLIGGLREIPRFWMISGAVAAIVIAILLIGYLVSDSPDAAVTGVSRAPEHPGSPTPDRAVAAAPQSQARNPSVPPDEQVASTPPAPRGSVTRTDSPPTSTGLAATRAPTDRSSQAAPAPGTSPSDTAGTARADTSVTSRAPAVAPEAPVATGSLVLQARAVDSTWVRVQWDGAPPVEEIIPRGETRRWEAGDHLLVVAGRAHGVQFRFQDELLGDGRLGKPTEILRFRASGDGVFLLGPDLRPTSRVDSLQESSATASDAAGP